MFYDRARPGGLLTAVSIVFVSVLVVVFVVFLFSSFKTGLKLRICLLVLRVKMCVSTAGSD